jgi:hypothetical protein
LALFLAGTAPNRSVRVFVGGVGAITGPTFATTNANVIYMKADGASSQFGINESYSTVNIGGTIRGAIFRVATNAGDNGEFFDGTIAEVFYFNAALADADRDRLTAYLTAKWGI